MSLRVIVNIDNPSDWPGSVNLLVIQDNLKLSPSEWKVLAEIDYEQEMDGTAMIKVNGTFARKVLTP